VERIRASGERSRERAEDSSGRERVRVRVGSDYAARSRG
jgi:hypothetical protein